jgi:hypothetical protein
LRLLLGQQQQYSGLKSVEIKGGNMAKTGWNITGDLFYCDSKAFGIIFRRIGIGLWEAKTVIISDDCVEQMEKIKNPLFCTLPTPGQKQKESPLDSIKPLDSPLPKPKLENKMKDQKQSETDKSQHKKRNHDKDSRRKSPKV